MAKAVDIDLDLVASNFDYNPSTGEIKWISQCGSGKKGVLAGSESRAGYLKLTLKGATILGHRVAWALHYIEQPPALIDHINGNKMDNRICNLRSGESCINQQNQKRAHSRNKTSKYIGVSIFKGRWRAKIYHAGKYYFLGYFENELAARDAYLAAKSRLHLGFIDPRQQ